MSLKLAPLPTPSLPERGEILSQGLHSTNKRHSTCPKFNTTIANNYMSNTTFKARPKSTAVNNIGRRTNIEIRLLHYLLLSFILEKTIRISHNLASISHTSLNISNCVCHVWVKIPSFLQRWGLTFIQIYQIEEHISLQNKVI